MMLEPMQTKQASQSMISQQSCWVMVQPTCALLGWSTCTHV